MDAYRVEFDNNGTPDGERHSLTVPDVATALVVADINLKKGVAELYDEDGLVATLEKHGRDGKTYWAVSSAP